MDKEKLLAEIVKLQQEVKLRREQQKQNSEIKEQVAKMLEDFRKEMARSQVSRNYDFLTDEDVDSAAKGHIEKVISTPISEQPDQELAKRVQDWNDQVILVSALTRKHPTQLKIWQSFAKGELDFCKALTPDVDAYGQDYVPTFMSSQFIDRMENNYVVANQFDKITVPRGVRTLELPRIGTRASVFKLTGSSVDDVSKIAATTPGTDKLSITPVRFGARLEIEDEMDEDSAIAIYPWARNELTRAAARAIDDCIINGDTSGTHQDSDVTSSADHRKLWNGLRKNTPSGSKVDVSDTVDITNFRKAWQTMKSANGDYGNPEDMVIFAELHGFLRLLQALVNALDINEDLVLTGKLNRVFGIPVIQSSVVRDDLNASGVYDGTTTNRTIIILANKHTYMLATKRAVRVERERWATTGRDVFVITARMNFVPKYATTEPVSAIMYNINTAS